jgi:hypothetical protein
VREHVETVSSSSNISFTLMSAAQGGSHAGGLDSPILQGPPQTCNLLRNYG